MASAEPEAVGSSSSFGGDEAKELDTEGELFIESFDFKVEKIKMVGPITNRLGARFPPNSNRLE
jgi:hypothetical protein